MKMWTGRIGAVAVLGLVVAANAGAATRVCSVYLESFVAFQKQMAQGAALFESPQLAGLPMMMTVSLPGFALVDTDKPIALHVVSTAPGKTGVILEVVASSGAEAYVQALAGNGAPLPAPVGGVYTLANGMAVRAAGNKVFLAIKCDDPAACLGGDGDAFPPLPDIAGALRVSVAPSALAPMMEQFKQLASKASHTGAASAEQGRLAIEKTFEFYAALLNQIDSYAIGLDVRDTGLFVNTRLSAKAGSDIAAMVASSRPVSPLELTFIDKESAFSFGAGGFAVPETLKRLVLDFYGEMIASSPVFDKTQTGEWKTIMEQSMKVFGVPMAYTGNLRDGALSAQGVLTVPDSQAYVASQVAMIKSDAYRKMMKQSGMGVSDPISRTYKGLTVYGYKPVLDEKAVARQMQQALPTNMAPEQAEAAMQANMGAMRFLTQFMGGGYEYAADARRVYMGMGAPAMVEQAIGRAQAPAASAEAVRIRDALGLKKAPCMLGRLSLAELVRAVSENVLGKGTAGGVPEPKPEGGEGVLFAQWAESGDSLSTLLFPAAEIKALVTQVQSAQMKASQKAVKTPVPGAASGGTAQP